MEIIYTTYVTLPSIFFCLTKVSQLSRIGLMEEKLLDNEQQDSEKKISIKRRAKEDFILSKATELFRKKGYCNTSMDDIGSAVGMLKPSLYYYFSSKDEILAKIVQPAMSEMLKILESVLHSDIPPLEKLERVINAHYAVLYKYTNVFYIISIDDINSIGTDLRTDIAQMRGHYRHLLSHIIDQGIEAGQIRKDIPLEIINYSLLGIINWMCRTYKHVEPAGALEIADRYLALITEGIKVNHKQTH